MNGDPHGGLRVMTTNYRQVIARSSDAEPNDYYATDPRAAHDLLRIEPALENIWEPACGEGHLAKVFDQYGKLGRATDLVDRGYGETLDFLSYGGTAWDGDIVTNPPYKYAAEFVLKALDACGKNHKVIMLLPVTFLETADRYDRIFSRYPPARVFVYSKRLMCAKNGDFDNARKNNSMKCYAWFVWWKDLMTTSPLMGWIR